MKKKKEKVKNRERKGKKGQHEIKFENQKEL